jgi:hypothetical protein
MKPNEPSRTALMIARQRAAHQLLDHGSILHDPLAMQILGEHEKDVLQFASAHPLVSIGRVITTARSRIVEDALSSAVERGVRRIVILGAGLDTFALRNPHGARQIHIYELDHPATQAWKRQRLAEAPIALPPWLILLPVDFERDDLGEKLVAAGFQQNSPAFFACLGVVPYLTQDAIGRTTPRRGVLDRYDDGQSSEVRAATDGPSDLRRKHGLGIWCIGADQTRWPRNACWPLRMERRARLLVVERFKRGLDRDHGDRAHV